MMHQRVIADLHIHSRFSRATSRKISPAYLQRWARIKGIDLLGSGDCSHPLWLAELRDQLDDAEPGLYKLKAKVRRDFDAGPAPAEGIPEGGAAEPRFVLTGEISTIYKKDDITRKIHHVVILPDFKAAAAFQARLERAGNIRSDGRPILGIDSRDLFSLLLDTDDRAVLIPAHIWTPWFSALGAKSGFDSIADCYGDLCRYIPAIETGLSSNPPMNWALSSLDKFSIISNSDAHSPEKLGREATIFNMELSYSSFRDALFAHQNGKTVPGILGTIEFFPQEGKYHYDGHRKCDAYATPEDAAAAGGFCPVCGKPFTRGVMGRVMELADRPVDETTPGPADGGPGSNRRPYHSLIPLREILGELLGTGPASKKVDAAYGSLIAQGGSEFAILMDMDTETLGRLHPAGLSGDVLAEAVGRMRAGEVSLSPGYDGVYGLVRVFAPGSVPGESPGFFETPGAGQPPQTRPQTAAATKTAAQRIKATAQRIKAAPSRARPQPRSITLERDQEEAVAYDGRWGIIIAGPGTGKTAVLTSRIIRLIEGGSDPASILALSFTVKAAGELRDRIARYTGRYIGGHTGRYTGGHIAGHIAGGLTAATFHSFCCALLREQEGTHGVPSNFRVLAETERRELLRKICAGTEGVKRTGAERLGAYIEGRKRYLLLPGETGPKIALSGSFAIPSPDPGLEPLYERYRQGLREASLLDFDDLPAGAARLLAADPGLLEKYRRRYRHILVDEYQDINFAQYALLSLLVPNTLEAPSLRVIGDPNQAIYAFRGSDPQFIGRFSRDYPEAGSFYLSRSFRCAAPVLEAAGRLSNTCLVGEDRQAGLSTVEYPTEKAEAEGIARRIEALVGGTGFFAFDSGSVDADDGPASQADVSPGDCAVLLRISGLAPAIAKALADHGIPWELTGEAPWWEEEPASSLILKLRAWTAEGSIPAADPGAVIRLAWEELQREKRPAGSRKGTWKDGEALDRLLAWAAMYDSLASFLDILALSGPGDGTLRRDAVRLMTIHASKGLEFDQVFIPALEEGIIPFTLFDGKHEDPAKIEEEKRLLYVAMTRTRQGLYLSRSRSRKIGNRKTVPAPSRFLEQLNGLIPQETATLRMRPEAPPVSQLPLFQGDAD